METNDELKRPYRTGDHTEELVDHYWGSLNHITGLIKSSELKAGLILSFYGILTTLVYQNVEMILTGPGEKNIYYIIGGAWFLCTIISIYYCVRCFTPRLEVKYETSVFFFEDVISKYGTEKEFAKTFYRISVDEEQLFDQLGQQIFINSKIASLKFRNVNKAIKFMGIGLIILMTIVLYYVIALGLS